MQTIMCPHCGSKIKIDVQKKYQDCPLCSQPFLTKDVIAVAPADIPARTDSLLSRLAQNIEKN